MIPASIQRWLRQPYPFTNHWRAALWNAIGSGVFVLLFLYIFKPFGTKVTPGAEMQFLGVCAMFGVVTAAVSMIITAFTWYFQNLFDEEKWVVGKEILFNLFFISCIGLGNLLLAYFLWHIPLNARTFCMWQVITFAVGIFPIIAGALVGQVKLSKRYATEAAQMIPKPHSVHEAEERFVLLEGDNQQEQLRLRPSQIAYIAAADNYVRVFYAENAELKSQMLRATMKKMEDSLAGHTYLFRCHRTYLVNLEMVQKVSGNAQGYRLHLEGIDQTIPVSRNLNDMVQKML